MARRYDQSTTTFSPEGNVKFVTIDCLIIFNCILGRLHQIEYAIEAINNAGTCIGITAKDGIILAAEKRVVSKLLAPATTSEKTLRIDNHIVSVLAGLTADADILIQQARLNSQRYLYNYQTPIPVENLVKSICNYMQAYTQYGGLRPFGVGFLLAGWDDLYNFQLYQTDPSGNYSGWKATVIGQNNQAGKSILKKEYVENESIAKNLRLAVKVLLKTMDSTTPSPERVDLSVVLRDADGHVIHQVIPESEVRSFVWIAVSGIGTELCLID